MGAKTALRRDSQPQMKPPATSYVLSGPVPGSVITTITLPLRGQRWNKTNLYQTSRLTRDQLPAPLGQTR